MEKWQKHPVLSQLNPSSDVIIVESPKCDKCVWSERERESERGNAEIAGLDNDGRMCGQLTDLKLQNFIP